MWRNETSVDARSTQRHMPEDDILHIRPCESLKSYLFTHVRDTNSFELCGETTFQEVVSLQEVFARYIFHSFVVNTAP
jgi:hypothetical protein